MKNQCTNVPIHHVRINEYVMKVIKSACSVSQSHLCIQRRSNPHRSRPFQAHQLANSRMEMPEDWSTSNSAITSSVSSWDKSGPLLHCTVPYLFSIYCRDKCEREERQAGGQAAHKARRAATCTYHLASAPEVRSACSRCHHAPRAAGDHCAPCCARASSIDLKVIIRKQQSSFKLPRVVLVRCCGWWRDDDGAGNSHLHGPLPSRCGAAPGDVTVD